MKEQLNKQDVHDLLTENDERVTVKLRKGQSAWGGEDVTPAPDGGFYTSVFNDWVHGPAHVTYETQEDGNVTIQVSRKIDGVMTPEPLRTPNNGFVLSLEEDECDKTLVADFGVHNDYRLIVTSLSPKNDKFYAGYEEVHLGGSIYETKEDALARAEQMDKYRKR